MWRRGWGGCRSVYTEAFCWINENATLLRDISIPWSINNTEKKTSLELNSSNAAERWKSKSTEARSECLMLELPKDAEDEDRNTERANGHAVPNGVYQLHHGKVLSLQ